MLYHERSYFSQTEAAQISGFSRQFIAAEIKRGHLVAVSRGRKRIISRTHLESWLASKPVADDASAALAVPAHGETSSTPVTDAERIVSALEAIVMELAGIRAAMAERAR